MKLDNNSSFSLATSEENPADPLVVFVTLHHAPLWEAVRYLAGYETSRVVDKCVAHLERDGRVTREIQIMIDQIRSVLALEHHDDAAFPLMAQFVALDPCDRVVDEICLLHDRLVRAMAESPRCTRLKADAPAKNKAA